MYFFFYIHIFLFIFLQIYNYVPEYYKTADELPKDDKYFTKNLRDYITNLNNTKPVSNQMSHHFSVSYARTILTTDWCLLRFLNNR